MAGAITFNGIGSGLDFSKLTDAIVAERTRPVTQLKAKSVNFTQRTESLKQLNARLVTLTEAAKALNNETGSISRQAISSSEEIVSASTSNSAVTGIIRLDVTRLASNLTQISRTYTATSSTVLVGGATTATFELRKGGAETGTAITLTTENDSLYGLRDAINQANAGVSASIIDEDGTGLRNRLVLNSTETGASGRVELVETTTTGTAADLNLASVGLTGGFADLDAQFKLNGLSLARSGNTVSNALTGVTLELKKTGTATVTVSEKGSDLTQKLQSFVTAYNEVQNFISGQYVKDASGKPGGVLAGDSTLRSVQQSLREAISSIAPANGGTFTRLAEIGLGRDESGKLTLDTKVLDEKLAKSFNDVKYLLSGKAADNKSLGDFLTENLSRLSDGVTGVVQTAVKGYQDSIRRIDRNVADQLERINLLRLSLSKQFAAADAAINQLNGQGTQLTNLFSAQKKND
jgi:flagellar hook-associated protein 2